MMKKVTLSVVAVLTCMAMMTVPMASAGDERSTFNFGPKAGVNIAYQWGGDIPEIGDTYAGFVAGLFLRIRLMDFLMLQPELLFSREGSSDLRIDYIQLPVFVKLGLPMGRVTPNVFAGPMGSFRVHDNNKSIVDVRVKDALFCMAFGAGVDIEIGRSLLTLEGRWTMSTMDSVTTRTTVLSESLKNGTGAFLVGFGF